MDLIRTMKYKISISKIIKIGLVMMIGSFALTIAVQPVYADALDQYRNETNSSHPDDTPTSPGNAPIIGVPSAVATSSPSSVADLVSKIVAFLGWLVGVSSVAGLLVGSLLYIISAGDPGKTRTAKDAIVFSIVGLVVALLAYGAVTFVLSKKG